MNFEGSAYVKLIANLLLVLYCCCVLWFDGRVGPSVKVFWLLSAKAHIDKSFFYPSLST